MEVGRGCRCGGEGRAQLDCTPSHRVHSGDPGNSTVRSRSALLDCAGAWGQSLCSCSVLGQSDIWRFSRTGWIGHIRVSFPYRWQRRLLKCPVMILLQRPDLEGTSQNAIWTALCKARVSAVGVRCHSPDSWWREPEMS